MFNPTPGPWTVERKNPGHDKAIEANAHLIAAAPELVEAGEEALKALTADTIGTIHMDDPDWYGQVDRAVEALRAALAKAKGQS